MEDKNQHLETLTEIRSLMERSSRFISLSGLSGISAGICALVGAYSAHQYLHVNAIKYQNRAFYENGEINFGFFTFLFVDALLVLFFALVSGSFFTIRKAKKSGQQFWDVTSKRLLINLLLPLTVGGIFCLILLYHGIYGLIAPSMLIFYGLALINASKYTLNDIRYLGVTEIILGLISSIFIGYGLLFWAIGFGVLHIVYGALMYFKYEK